MPTSWRNVYTDLSNVNSGNELENGDDILAQHINVALENGAYVKEKVDEMESLKTIRQHIFSFTIIPNQANNYIKVTMNLTLQKTQQLTISELKNLLASLGAFNPNGVISTYDSYDALLNIGFLMIRLQYVNDNNLTIYYLRDTSSVEQGNISKVSYSVSDIRFDNYKII